MANTNFSQLKKNRKSNFEKLTEELQKASGKVEYKDKDDRFWYPAVDKVGNGFAVIRFLPAPQGEDVPFVRVFSHSFQGPTGSWYIENSLTTLGKQDPVGEYNTKLWNLGKNDDSEERKQARKQKRKLTFYSNIYVVTDPANPENEGKVKLFKYGKKIMDKIFEAANPPKNKDGTLVDPDVKPMDAFDLWEEGANLKIKIKNVGGFRNYDSSVFDKVGPLFKDEKVMESTWKNEHSLQEFIAASQFKDYNELQTKLHRVLGLGDNGQQGLTNQLGGQESSLGWKAPTKPKAQAPKPEPDIEAEDDDLDYFKNLAEEDESLIA